jgi:hypothetical protein
MAVKQVVTPFLVDALTGAVVGFMGTDNKEYLFKDLTTGSSFVTTSGATVFPAGLSDMAHSELAELDWAPTTASSAVVAARQTVLSAKTNAANMIAPGHGIGDITLMAASGGGSVNLLMAEETRIQLRDSTTVTELVGTKFVFDPANVGTLNTLTLHSLDDNSASAPYVTVIRDQYLDPRYVCYNNGGLVQTPNILAANYTFKDSDSGKTFYWNSASNGTLTVPTGLTDGARFTIKQGTLGGTVTIATSGRAVLGNSPRLTTLKSLDSVEVLVAGSGAYLVNTWQEPLPIFATFSTAVMTLNATTMVNLTGLSGTVEANATYEVDILVSFSSAIVTQALKLGLASLPTGSVQLEGVIYNTNVAGTSTPAFKSMLSSAEAVTGVAGATSVTSGQMLGRIRGRITTTAAGTFTVTCGAIGTTGNLTIAIGDAYMKLQKVA